MAKNWTLAEATHEIFKGDNKETIIDIGRRFPMLLTLVKGSLEGNKEDFVNLIRLLRQDEIENGEKY